LARVLGHIETVEPLLRRGSTAEIRTDVPLDEVVQQILDLVQAGGISTGADGH